jgi:two-component system cell cycle response regulator
MKPDWHENLSSFWSRPDPVLAAAGKSGELLMAKIRLSLAVVLLLIPVLNGFVPMDPKESLVGFSLTVGTFLFAATAYFLVSREINPSWLSFASSSLDVTLVSSALVAFLVLNQPHTAVNSKVVFEGYFLAIGSTSLRYDQRVCVTAGLLAIGEYFAIVYYAANKWDLNSGMYAPFPYGMFSWTNQISRLIVMFVACALSVAIVSRAQRLLRMATVDSLTSLFNRGYVDDRFAIELSRAQRHGQPLAIAMIDVDRFKLFNDTHGHAAGDFALRTIAVVLRQFLRQSDTVGRYGGEEFVVIMPETDIAMAQLKLDALRQTIANTPIPLRAQDRTVSVTFSAGIAGFPGDGADQAELLATADERLFQAKRTGRNRVVAISGSVPAEAAPFLESPASRTSDFAPPSATG